MLKRATSFEDFLKKLQDLYPLSYAILGEISKVSHLPYDPKPEQVVKLLQTLERLFDKLNSGVVTEERKLMELSSKINDKLFVECLAPAPPAAPVPAAPMPRPAPPPAEAIRAGSALGAGVLHDIRQ